jgi:hypothetical protein
MKPIEIKVGPARRCDKNKKNFSYNVRRPNEFQKKAKKLIFDFGRNQYQKSLSFFYFFMRTIAKWPVFCPKATT